MAESFGVDAERYDRTRPGYPDAMVERIVAASPGRDVVNVGCGTGIEARQFQAAGCTVLGVEPDARMAEFARRTGLAVEVATFEKWESAGREFDAVIAGTAWHWVEPVAGAAKAARVLRPGGRLAAFWHVFQLPEELAKPFGVIYQRVVPDSPVNVAILQNAVELYQTILDRAADGMRAAGGFGAADKWRYDWEQTYTRDEWLELMPTHGGMTRLSAGQRAAILAGVGAAIDAVGGSFTLPYATLVITAVHTG
jgi:SAM-dependent methyltransferase